jgi:hypothetical protein
MLSDGVARDNHHDLDDGFRPHSPPLEPVIVAYREEIDPLKISRLEKEELRNVKQHFFEVFLGDQLTSTAALSRSENQSRETAKNREKRT